MNTFLENPNDGSLRFSDVEVRLAEFLKTFDPEPYKVHSSLYYFEENVFGEIVAALRNCKLPKHFLSYKDVLREKLIEKLGFSTQDLILCTDGIVYAKRFLLSKLWAKVPKDAHADSILPDWKRISKNFSQRVTCRKNVRAFALSGRRGFKFSQNHAG